MTGHSGHDEYMSFRPRERSANSPEDFCSEQPTAAEKRVEKSFAQPENHLPHLPRLQVLVSCPSAYGSVKMTEPSTKFSQHPLIINYLQIYTVDGDFWV